MRSRPFPTKCAAAGVMPLLLLCGCHAAAYDAALAKRQKAVHDAWTNYAADQSGRPMNTERLAQTASQMQRIYNQRLEETLRMIRQESRKRYEGWIAEESVRARQIQKSLEARPESMQEAGKHLTP